MIELLAIVAALLTLTWSATYWMGPDSWTFPLISIGSVLFVAAPMGISVVTMHHTVGLRRWRDYCQYSVGFAVFALVVVLVSVDAIAVGSGLALTVIGCALTPILVPQLWSSPWSVRSALFKRSFWYAAAAGAYFLVICGHHPSIVGTIMLPIKGAEMGAMVRLECYAILASGSLIAMILSGVALGRAFRALLVEDYLKLRHLAESI